MSAVAADRPRQHVRGHPALQGRKDANVSAILGCEVNVSRAWGAPGARARGRTTVDHLVLSPRANDGYKNLVRIVSAGTSKGSVGLAGAHASTLDARGPSTRGLVGLTGCLGGVLAQRRAREGERPGARARPLSDVVEPGLALRRAPRPRPARAADRERHPRRLASDLELPAGRHQRRPLRRATTARRSSTSRASRRTGRSFADAKAATTALRDVPEERRRDGAGASATTRGHQDTLAIAEMCTGSSSSSARRCCRSSRCPRASTTEGYFRHVAREGLERRFRVRRAGRRSTSEAYRRASRSSSTSSAR
jgi:DNA polymerase-3 subunit alpha